ncbi:MAG: ornithine carbamoyltransferase, partial [Calditrichaeota bacterium]|nr:ornithine carbamoyltransferase [Calditrichota bacterium]
KPSTRTRCAFTVATIDEGGHPEYLGPNDIQMGKKESIEDTAKVLGRMFDGIQFRGFYQTTVEGLAKHAGVPVWNGLTNEWHPTQILADFLTVKENFNRLKGIRFAYIGDGRNNMANSLMVGSAKMGLDFRVVAPKQLFPDPELVKTCQKLASESGVKITITDSIESGVNGCDVLYTDVWASMGEEDQIPARIKLLKKYQVNMNMAKLTKNPDMIFLHCLPAFHDEETKLGKEFPDIKEVSDDLFRSTHSRVFDQAENRLHTIKAVMLATL